MEVEKFQAGSIACRLEEMNTKKKHIKVIAENYQRPRKKRRQLKRFMGRPRVEVDSTNSNPTT